MIQVHTKKYHLYALEAVSTGLWPTFTAVDWLLYISYYVFYLFFSIFFTIWKSNTLTSQFTSTAHRHPALEANSTTIHISWAPHNFILILLHHIIIIIFHNDHLFFFLRRPEPSHPDGCLLNILRKKERNIMTEHNNNETLTHLVHEPEEREQSDDERCIDPDLHQRYLRLRPAERDFGRFVYDRPRVDLFALHERGQREHAQDVPALLVYFLMNDGDRKFVVDFVVLAPRELSVAYRRVVGSLPRVTRAIPDEVVRLGGHCLCRLVFRRIFVLELECFLLQPLVPLHLKHC